MPEPLLTWEADEVRRGTRKIPGYAGHLGGYQHKVGLTFGTSSAEVLGPNADHLIPVESAILRHRNDGYTTPGHPDCPFKEEIYRKKPKTPGFEPRIIPGYAGHRPGWQLTHGETMGKYSTGTLGTFTMTTRRTSKHLRVKTAPADIYALPEPEKPPPPPKLYSDLKSYIPNTTCYPPAIRERFGHGFGTLTRQAFINPLPKVGEPLIYRQDGVIIDHLSLPAGYAGYIPRVLPKLYDKQPKEPNLNYSLPYPICSARSTGIAAISMFGSIPSRQPRSCPPCSQQERDGAALYPGTAPPQLPSAPLPLLSFPTAPPATPPPSLSPPPLSPGTPPPAPPPLPFPLLFPLHLLHLLPQHHLSRRPPRLLALFLGWEELLEGSAPLSR